MEGLPLTNSSCIDFRDGGRVVSLLVRRYLKVRILLYPEMPDPYDVVVHSVLC
jgi:hypothetical protein